ncbi:protein of unknown function [Methylotuvimicrobium alcaliphilum 20Z]|uniref:Uncharacterized protein n=1 Tax=Methylotuvimicrobium alcaliphilum (strain DSM 19304 / NCIMB 14124 / VKM B-2133 / 20Z) TaxID=1091494 RepID=G4SVB0_META2|nr:protein of unknown function [Methylotuvimicrobium alcaliphilum 20Z]
MHYFPFGDWDHLKRFMLKGLNGTIPGSGYSFKMRIAAYVGCEVCLSRNAVNP